MRLRQPVASRARRSLLILSLVSSMPLFATTPEEYASRRAALAKAIGPDSMLILTSPKPAQRNGDVDWPFRQEDSLLYLTGLESPGTSLLLVPGEKEHSEVVFSRDSDPTVELWTGHISTAEEVEAKSGVREVISSERFRDFVRTAMEGRPWGILARSYAGPALPEWGKRVRGGRAVVWTILEDRAWGETRSTPGLELVADLRRSYPELQFRDAFPLLAAMRMVKSPAEIATVQRAIDATLAAQKAAMRRVKTARHEYEVQATIEFTFRDSGACCWAFPSIVAAGRNATTLHYGTNNDPIVPGGLLLTDLGAEVDGYSADVTRTYPQSGRFSPEQRAVYEAVLKAQSGSMPKMKAGVSMREAQDEAIRILGEELLAMGLVAKNEPTQVRWYFPHGLGHHLGLRTHDANERGAPLAPGMIVTNEPGLYVRPAAVRDSKEFQKLSADEQKKIEAALAKYDGIGVRIEDDILITDGEPKNLSAAAPRTVAEIEGWMRGD